MALYFVLRLCCLQLYHYSTVVLCLVSHCHVNANRFQTIHTTTTNKTTHRSQEPTHRKQTPTSAATNTMASPSTALAASTSSVHVEDHNVDPATEALMVISELRSDGHISNSDAQLLVVHQTASLHAIHIRRLTTIFLDAGCQTSPSHTGASFGQQPSHHECGACVLEDQGSCQVRKAL